MRRGAAAGTVGYYHETCLYGSDRELLDLAGPFLQEGLDAGEPTVVSFAPHNAAVFRDAFGPDAGIRYVPSADQYARPASAIATYRRLFAELVDEGADQIRVIGDVPHPGTGSSWQPWLRYEVAADQAYAAFPVWGICPYDLRTTPEEVLDDVLATHPHRLGADGHGDNPTGTDSATRMGPRLRARPARHPMQSQPPQVVLRQPTPPTTRTVAIDVARSAGLTDDRADEVVVVSSELVTNACLHGTPPVTLEMWAETGRVLVAVTDAGPGPTDVLAGLVGPDHTAPAGGRGLWITQQLATEVTLDYQPDGFTIRALVSG
jgi:anti-sigma regulatory factor (Ser/Thr protein kinase)